MRKRYNHTVLDTNYSSVQHSGHLSRVRFDTRRRAIEACSPDKRILRKLGLETILQSRDLPTVYFCSKLATITTRPPVPNKDGNLPPESPQLAAFDHVLSVPALPDHLISTMTSIVLKLCFEKLESDRDHAIVEKQIVDGVFTICKELRRKTFSWQFLKKGVQYKRITSNTTSSWFASLLISLCVFADVFKASKQTAHLLPRKLQLFVSVLYK